MLRKDMQKKRMERRRLSSHRSLSQSSPPDAVSLIYHMLPCPVQCCYQKFIVSTDHSGDLHVHVQGDLSQQDKRCVFLTVHDLGCNHMSMVEFVNSPAMMEIKERSCFIHVDVPGHEDGAPDLPDSYQFPSLCTLGEDLVTVLDAVRAPYAVALGEGAGGAILARAALAHPRRILALAALTTGAASASFVDGLRAKLSRWRPQDVEDFLVYHKFGTSASVSGDASADLCRDRAVLDYRSRLRGSFNPHNVKLYVKAFLARKELSLRGCAQDVLLLTGALSPYVADAEKLYRDLDKDKATFLKIEKVADIFAEAPGKMAQSLLLFCQGQGLLTSLPPPGVARRVSRAMSMEEYDRPNVRRLSLTPANANN